MDAMLVGLDVWQAEIDIIPLGACFTKQLTITILVNCKSLHN
jgi:hypothetical protein